MGLLYVLMAIGFKVLSDTVVSKRKRVFLFLFALGRLFVSESVVLVRGRHRATPAERHARNI